MDAEQLEQRRAEWLMWQRLAARRKPHTRGWWRANVHANAAAFLVESAYRILSAR